MKRAVKKYLDADKVTVTPIPGGERYEVTRGECRAKFDLHGDHVNWVALTSPGEQGWVLAAHNMVREVFPEHGIKYLTCSAADDQAEQVLRAHGQWQSNGRGLRWDL